jgi:hypothetical protein
MADYRPPENQPTLNSGCDGDRSFHVRVNVTVIRERSRRCEGELEGLVLREIPRGSEDPSCITGHRMGSIRGIEPFHLRSSFDRECSRLEGVHPIRLNNLHGDNFRG